MPATYDVAIAGAGIVGAAVADECAAAGLRVVVVEPGPTGGGATGAGMGHIVVMDDSLAQLALTRYSVALWRELALELPPEVEYAKTGTIWVAADAEEMAEVECKRQVYTSAGVRADVLDERSLAEAEPQLRAGLAGGLLVPDDAVIYPPSAARFLLERAQARGAELRVGTAVELPGVGQALPPAKASTAGIRLRDSELLAAGIVVNATGAWAPELTPGIEVRKRKGHLAITDRYPGFVRHQLVELGYLKSAHSSAADSVAFNAQPRRTGQVLIGSSRQYDAPGPDIEAPILSRMLRRAQEYLPRVTDLLVIRCWTGFRAATPDKLPLIGPVAGSDRLYLATGHEGLGITTSLATGKLVADHILGRPSAIPREAYLPGRKHEAQHG
ncbi:MAG: FAD-dependent oxidoreductase [Bryobacteraceae bacterium]|jgi:glycine/D-amino acid oxidase-like deaminating enzyme